MTFLAHLLALSGLVVSLLLPISPVSAKDPDTCSAQASHVMQWTIYRLQGITKQQLLEALDFSKVSKELERDIRRAIDFIFEGKDPDPMKKGEEWFKRCLKSPEYGSEKEV